MKTQRLMILFVLGVMFTFTCNLSAKDFAIVMGGGDSDSQEDFGYIISHVSKTLNTAGWEVNLLYGDGDKLKATDIPGIKEHWDL